MLRKQVVTKPAEPLTVASCTDDDDTSDVLAAEDVTDEPPPGVDEPGSDASADNKSKVCIHCEFFTVLY